jgi:hypothetical protein
MKVFRNKDLGLGIAGRFPFWFQRALRIGLAYRFESRPADGHGYFYFNSFSLSRMRWLRVCDGRHKTY